MNPATVQVKSATSSRRSHAVLDINSRRWKAQKIERLLKLETYARSVKMLEIGTGSGGIANYFGTHKTLKCDVDAVDVEDSRLIEAGFRFTKVAGVELPFEDAIFDVVISNHVIEHVGDSVAQLTHLQEIRRVLKPDGVGYLAVPNRWMVTEPHYQLMFLSWWPRSWRTPYLRMMGKGTYYDCEPLQMRQLERMLQTAGLCVSNLCVKALRETLEIEHPESRVARVLRYLPDLILHPLRRFIPTLIYRIERSPQ